jgi:hypothetical protein
MIWYMIWYIIRYDIWYNIILCVYIKLRLWSVCSFSAGGEQPITWSIKWNSCIGDLYLLIIRGNVSILSKLKIVPWFRWFSSGISIRGTAFSSRPSLVGLCWKSDEETVFSPITLTFSCQYHSQVLYTCSLVCHRRCIMLVHRYK